MRNRAALLVLIGMCWLGSPALAQEAAQAPQPAPAPETAAPKTDPAAEKAMNEIVAAWNKLRSVSAAIEASTTMPGPQGSTLSVTGSGAFEYLKKGESGCSRVELAVKPAGATSDVTLADILCVFDGKEGAAQVQMFGQTRVTKLPVDEPETSKPTGHLVADLLRGHFAINLLPDADIDGQHTCEVEATPLFEAPREMALKTLRVSFAKDSGVPLKLEAIDAAGAPQLTVRFKNVQLNPEIGEDRFVLPSPAAAPEASAGTAAGSATAPETPAGTPAASATP